MSQINAFTVDVEDYFQVTAFEGDIDRNGWGSYPQRIVANTHRILELLAKFDARATFYTLGWVADHHPSLVRQISAAGHELGCHSYWHRLVYQLSPQEFRRDVRRSKQAIEDAAGVAVESYRAPSFSLTAQSTWAWEILVEEGFKSDSSVFPVVHDRYGIPDAVAEIHEVETPAGSIWEFPLSVRPVAGFRMPVSGGGYFRLYPYWLTARCFEGIERSGRPFIFYIHPWEVDPEQPRLGVGSRTARFRHYVNLGKTHAKLTRLLQQFQFGTVADVLADQGCDRPESEQCLAG